MATFRFKLDGFAWREVPSLAEIVSQLRAVPASEMVELEGPGIRGRMFVADVFDLYRRSLGLGGGS